jgi:tRNA pseudouridine55 synthase
VTGPPAPPHGLLVVDKPKGMTSHDVVSRVRRLAGTRRIGHAGTLDPMATGVLVLGVGRATRLLGYLAGGDKAYEATIRLGEATVTDDAEGDVLAAVPAGAVTAAAVRAAATGLTGEIAQVPASVSAVKVRGRRSYARVRAGEQVALAPRAVTVRRFEVRGVRPLGEVLDVEVAVECSSGTYVRALARDLGVALGVGGHLTALRRTRAGGYGLEAATPLTELGPELPLVPLARAAAEAFPSRHVDAAEAARTRHGVALPAIGMRPGPVAVFGPDGAFLALVEEVGDRARPLVVFAG